MKIDVRSYPESPVYAEFQTSHAGELKLNLQHWMRIASRLSEFELMLALMAIPNLRLPEARRIAQYFKGGK